MTNCNFTNNSADYGGAVYLYYGNVINCNFTNNTANSGSVVYLFYGNLTNCIFTNNSARGSGVVYFEEGVIVNSIFTNNSADAGGAVYLNYGNVINCNFTNNTSNGIGGAVYCDEGSVTNSQFTNNSAIMGGGGAVYCDDGSVTNSQFTNNSAIMGGAIILSKGNLSNCNFTNNSATMNAGAVYCGEGSVTNSKFINNSAAAGGAILLGNGNLSNCNFTNNSATDYGGAVYCGDDSVVNNCSFVNNRGSYRNIYNDYGGSLTLEDNKFHDTIILDNEYYGCGDDFNVSGIIDSGVYNYGITSLTVQINDTASSKFEANVVNPNFTFKVVKNSLNIGTYTLIGTDSLNNEYILTSAQTFNVIAMANVIINNINPVTYPADVVITYTANATVTGAVVYIKGTTTEAGSVIYNNNQATVSGLGAGEYTINITAGDATHTETSAAKDFSVRQAATTITLSGKTSIIEGESTTITATVTNSNGITATLDGANTPVSGYTVTVRPDIGSHTLKVTTIPKDDNYTASTAQVTITVNPKVIPSTIVIPKSTTIDYGSIANITANTTGASAITATLYNGSTKIKDITPVGFVIPVDVNGLTIANYTLKVTTIPLSGYTPATAEGRIIVKKAVPALNVDDIDPIVYGSETIILVANYDGDYTVIVGDGEPITVSDVAAGKEKIVNIGKLDANNYTVKVQFRGNENYTESNIVEKNLTVTKANVTITITAVDVTYPGDVIVNVSSDVSGTYFLFINTTSPQEIELEAGTIKEIQIPGLNAGTYEFTLAYLETDNYNAATESVNATVAKANVSMSITAVNVTYPEDIVLTLLSDVSGNYNLQLDATTPQKVALEAGVAKNVNFSKVDAGTHKFTLAYTETENYNPARESINVTVAKANVTMSITAVNVTYPDDIILTLLSDVSGNYILQLDATTPQKVALEAGVAKNVNFSKVDAGTHKFTLAYTETGNYNPARESINVSVAKGNVTMSITAVNVTYPEDIILTLLSDVSGNYSLQLDTTTPQKIGLKAGVAKNVNYGKIDAGTHKFTLAYTETENYNPATQSFNVTVAKANITMSITAVNVTYPEDIILTLLSDVSGNYNLQHGTKTPQKVRLEAGVAKNVNFSKVDAGTHEFTLVYMESENYNAATESVNVTVAKANVNMSITSEDVVYPNDVIVTVMSDVSGRYSLFKGMVSPKYIDLEAGVAKEIKFSNLDAGTYEFALVYLETTNYNTGRTAINVTVNKVENTTMSINATSPFAGENATVTVTLPADATGNVSVKYGNGVYFADVINGTAAVSVPTTVAGTEAANVTYNGDNNYAPASSEVNITVKAPGVIIAENIKRGVNSPYDYYATLVDAEGQPIRDVEITFTIDGETYKAKTNASGIATVSAGLEVVDGKDTVYNVTVTNPYTFENTTATTTIVPRLIVVSGNLTADYLENPPYIIQAIGDDGEHVGANVTVRIVFAGFYYDLKTNATGHVVRTIALAPGLYAVRGEYQGYKTEQTPFKVLQILKASSGTIKKTAKTYTLKATLKHTNGKAITGAEVKLNFNGKTYTVKTNSKGVASYTIKSSVIKKLKAGKTYVLKAKYMDDWTKGTWQGKIKVVKK